MKTFCVCIHRTYIGKKKIVTMMHRHKFASSSVSGYSMHAKHFTDLIYFLRIKLNQFGANVSSLLGRMALVVKIYKAIDICLMIEYKFVVK